MTPLALGQESLRSLVASTYSFLQNPWRKRTTSSRPRKILSGTPPNTRRRYFRYIEDILRYIDIE